MVGRYDNSPEDFHLQVIMHAGHTKKKTAGTLVPAVFAASKHQDAYFFAEIISSAKVFSKVTVAARIK